MMSSSKRWRRHGRDGLRGAVHVPVPQRIADWRTQLLHTLLSLVHHESNRFTYGWAAEALRRLAPTDAHCDVAFSAFLNGGRRKPPQMQLELALRQEVYGADPLFPTLYAAG